MQITELVDLYKIHSESGNEKQMCDFIESKLIEMGLKYNRSGNILFYFKPKTVLLSCHIDQVQTKPAKDILIKGNKISATNGLGADDKNGIFIVLNLLKDFGNSVSFLFSDQEESGGNIDQLLWNNYEIIERMKYALVFDRQGSGDIIGTQNDYCVDEFEDDVEFFGKEYGYKKAYGLWSDSDAISEYISCVNLSVGYYMPHTEKEYTLISDVIRCYCFALDILYNITKQYGVPDKDCFSKHWTFGDSVDIPPNCPHCGAELNTGCVEYLHCLWCGFDLDDDPWEDYSQCKDCGEYSIIGEGDTCPDCSNYIKCA